MPGSRSWVRPSLWVLEPPPSSVAPSGQWSNADMDPVPVSLRTWTTWNFVAYWITSAANIAAWELASSMLAVGLSWRQALVAIAIGHTLISVVIVLNGTIGARLHIPFPVLIRSSFGFWFSYFAVISRVVLSMFWFGIQSYTGGEGVYQMLKAIWPSIGHLPNHLPDSAGITTTSMLTYFLFWTVQFPFMLLSPQRIRLLFVVKSIVVPVTWFAMLIWSIVRVPTSISLKPQHTALSGVELDWAYMSAINSALGVWLTVGVNIPDFSRYAKHERSQLIQLVVIPQAFTLVGFIGIAVTSAGQTLYGETIWDPLKLVDRWDNRAAAFFVALSFVLATIGTNVSANSLSAANDMTALLPRYINIRRGQVLCAILGGWSLCPWKILDSAPGFLSFMSGYTIFLAPFAAIMATDYWLVHSGRVDVPAMYNPKGRYRYWHGINYRALVALLLTAPPAIPGLIASIRAEVNVGGALHLFQIDSLFGFFAGGFVYWTLSTLFPNSEARLPDKPSDVEAMTSEVESEGKVDEDPEKCKSFSS
ncbi:cytosine-purine permease [Mucidula mucida]|nr:cytosine-purine permease [Mucidula mucida]